MEAMHVLLRREGFWRVLAHLGCWVAAAYLLSLPWLAADTLIHVKMGERIASEPGFPRDDVFSYGETKPIESTQWLSEVILYLVYTRFGEPGLIGFKWILGLLSMILVFLCARMNGASRFTAHLGVLLTAVLIAYFLNMRPRQFSLIFFPLLLIFLHRLPRLPPFAPLFYLPFRVAWLNMHGEVLLGDLLVLVFVGAALLERVFRHLPGALASQPLSAAHLWFFLPVLLLLFPSNALNPYRPPAAGKAYAPTLPVHDLLTEWQRFQFLNPINRHVFFYLIFALGVFLYAWRTASLREAGIFGLFWFFPFYVQRTVPVTAVVTTPLVAAWLSRTCRPPSEPERGAGHSGPSVLVSALRKYKHPLLLTCCPVAIAYMFNVPFGWHIEQGLFDPERRPRAVHPVDAVHFIRLNRPPGRMYNDFDWGAYLIFHLYPDYQVALDARFTAVYREDYLQEAMNVMYGHPDWEKFLDKHKVSWVLIKKNRPLYGLLDRSRRWVWIYEDDWAAIFMRRSKVTEDFLKRAFEWKLSYPRSAIFERGFGAALVRRGEFDRALDFLLRAQKKLPEDPLILDWMAVAYIGKGERDRALQALKEAINVDPSYANAHAHLALWYAEEGQVDSARRHAEEALRHDPHNPIALDIKEALLR